MNIPKEIIEKAISGGWRPHNGTDYSHHKIRKANKRGGCYLENESRTTFLDFRHTVVDPTFWQALGKSLKWSNYAVCSTHGQYCILNCSQAVPFEWMYQAHRFYDLILQGQDTGEFWKELTH